MIRNTLLNSALMLVISLLPMGCGGDPVVDEEIDESVESAVTAAPVAKTWIVKVAPGGAHAFSPRTVAIKKGDTVKWIWQSDFHTVTSGSGGTPDGKFNSGSPQTTGNTFSFKFNAPGTFPYFCVPHVSMGMSGSIVVK